MLSTNWRKGASLAGSLTRRICSRERVKTRKDTQRRIHELFRFSARHISDRDRRGAFAMLFRSIVDRRVGTRRLNGEKRRVFVAIHTFPMLLLDQKQSLKKGSWFYKILVTKCLPRNVFVVLIRTRSPCVFLPNKSRDVVKIVFFSFLGVENLHFAFMACNGNVSLLKIAKRVSQTTSALCEQAVQQTADGPATRSPPCWKATSASATISTSRMGTSATPCPLSGWLSATVRQRLTNPTPSWINWHVLH